MATSLRVHQPLLLPSPSPRSRKGGNLCTLASTQRVEKLRLRAPTIPLRGTFHWPRRIRALNSTQGEAAETATAEEATGAAEVVSEVEITDSDESKSSTDSASALMTLLQSYKAAVANNDESRISGIESSLHSIQEEKDTLAAKISLLSLDLTAEKDRVLRISADLENFQKRTERERLSLMTNVQGEVVEKLLPVLDNFERAKDQIKVETEREQKITNGYQSIYKQFHEVLNALGVEPVETVGHQFDPMLHDAIMHEQSMEFEEGIVLQEFRKGYKLGERLLRPTMVKVSAGPGPAKEENSGACTEAADDDLQTRTEDMNNGKAA